MKGPIEYQTRTFQEELLRNGTREQLIAWLSWNDPNGTYTDKDSMIEGMLPITLEKAREIMRRQVDPESAESLIPSTADTAANEVNMEEIDRLVKTDKYVFIVAWGKFLGFTPATVLKYVRQAEEDNAPPDAIQKIDGRWSVLDDIVNESNRRRIEEIARG